jgi:hypothetical protein
VEPDEGVVLTAERARPVSNVSEYATAAATCRSSPSAVREGSRTRFG